MPLWFPTAAATAAKGGGLSSALGTIGKVVGLSSSIGGLFGGKNHDNSWKQHLQFLVADAKKAGIHPLAALGASANYAPSFETSGNARLDGLRAVGRDLTGISAEHEARLAARDEVALRHEQMQLERARTASQLKNDESQRAYWGALTAKALRDANRSNSPGGAISSALLGDYKVVPPEVTGSRPGAGSLQAGPARPFLVPIQYGEGEYGEQLMGAVPDQNMGDAELPANAYWLMGMGNLLWRDIMRRFGYYSDSRASARRQGLDREIKRAIKDRGTVR